MASEKHTINSLAARRDQNSAILYTLDRGAGSHPHSRSGLLQVAPQAKDVGREGGQPAASEGPTVARDNLRHGEHIANVCTKTGWRKPFERSPQRRALL